MSDSPPPPSLEQLRAPGSEAISVRADGSMAEVIEAFRARSALRLLAVLDAGGRPVGAILERDVRTILFNPYGHALLRNRGFGGTLRARIRDCPVADVADGLGESLAAYSRSGGAGEGLILTRDGRYHGIIENHVLLNAAGALEIDRVREREARLDRLQAAGIDFRRDIETLTLGLAEVAAGLGGTAAETADRGRTTGHRAIAVTAAAAQTCQAMAEVASHSGALMNAFERLNDETATARSVASQAVKLVEAGSRRTDALYESSRSIETITTSIDGLAGKVNMLAINATIEAARAGDAGRGFAVVANEVRGLAAQTRAALQTIREHALAIRGAVSEVVTGHDGIARVVASVERISQTLESTVQAQRAATHEMAAGADQAAAASREIGANVEAIGQAAAAAATGATGIQGTARTIEHASRQLTDRVAAFVARMTAT